MPNDLPDYRPTIAREIGKIGQVRAAELSGLKQPHISAWLAGKPKLSLWSQLRLAEALGCRVTWPAVEPPQSSSGA